MAVRNCCHLVPLCHAAYCSFDAHKGGGSGRKVDPVQLKVEATRVLETYCVSCHGPEKQKGKIRFDVLESIDAVDRQALFAQVQDVVHLKEMPPDEANQPTTAERESLLRWVNSQLTGKAAKALEEKLQRFEYGNVVPHEQLFSGDYSTLPGSTSDRRWLISEFIFNEKINRLLDYRPARTIYGSPQQVHGDSGVHWSPKTERGSKSRRAITNP